MNAARRLPPDDPARRGWCPSLARPMPTGDGLLARVHPPLSVLSAAQLRAVAGAARRFGNGHVDVTARGNLQIRGVREETAGAVSGLLAAVGLGDVRGDGGPQRLTLTSPLAGFDPNERIDVLALARAVETVGLATPGLPAKTLVAIDGGGRWGLGKVGADFFLASIEPERVAIGFVARAGVLWSRDVTPPDAVHVLGKALAAFAATGRRRMRDLDEGEQTKVAAAAGLFEASRNSPSPLRGRRWPLRRQGSGEGSDISEEFRAIPSPALSEGPLPRRGGSVAARLAPTSEQAPQPGLLALPTRSAIVIEAPFGRCEADGLDHLADIAASARTEIRTSRRRGFALPFEEPENAQAALEKLAAAGFIVDPTDPRRAVAACPGAPACASGTTPVPEHAAQLAKTFAPFAARGLTAHVSGCAKGCAHPRKADLTLVAEDGRYRVVVDGAPGDAGQGPRLTFEAVLDRVRRADPAESLAGVFRS